MARNAQDFINGTFGSNYGDTTKYLHGTGENALGTQSGATVKIEHPHTEYTTHADYDDYNSADEPEAGSARFERHVNRHEGDQFDDSGRQFKDTGQLPLFTTRHIPPVLSYMTATKDATPQAMQTAAHAAEETRRRFGERPWASSNTSEHSTPMVNAGIKSGIIKGVIGQAAGEKATASNDMGWENSLRDMSNARGEHAYEFNDIPKDDFKGTVGYSDWSRHDPAVVKTDFDNIKEELRAKHTSGQPNQFENVPLPGMSNANDFSPNPWNKGEV